jgi:hypothetical protein
MLRASRGFAVCSSGLLVHLSTHANSNCEDHVSTKIQMGMGIKNKKFPSWDDNWDYFEVNKGNTTTTSTRPIRQIILIRHGQYVESPPLDPSLTKSECSRDSQQILTILGRKQALLTGHRLKDLLAAGKVYPIDTVYFSTMMRATETCKLVLRALSGETVDEDAILNKGIDGMLQPHQIKPCSMIQEGVVYRADPPFKDWPVSERDMLIDNSRVRNQFH